MSKSRKKQRARAQAPQHTASPAPAEPTLALPEKQPQALNEALYERVVRTATHAGQFREEADRLVYLYNGPTIAVKYVEPSEDAGKEADILVAAFRRGVVFQVIDGQQMVYQPGDWEDELERISAEAPPDDLDEDADSEPDEDDAAEST